MTEAIGIRRDTPTGAAMGPCVLDLDELLARLRVGGVGALVPGWPGLQGPRGTGADQSPEPSPPPGTMRPESVLREALLLGAQALERDPRQLAGQLAGRLAASPQPGLRELAEQACRRGAATWLRPQGPSLVAPGGVLLTSVTLAEPDATAVALTTAGRVLTGGADGTVRWREGLTGEDYATLRAHRRAVTALAVAPDGRTVVTGSADCAVRWWELASGKVATLGHLDDWVTAVAVTPDGQRVLAGGADGQLRGWDVSEPSDLSTHRLHTDPVRALAFAPSGQAAVSAAEDGTLIRWSLDGPPGAAAELARDHRWITSVAVLPDGQLLAGHADGGITVRDADGQTVRATLTGHLDAVSALAAPGGHVALSASVGHTIRAWDLRRVAEADGQRFGPREPVSAAAVTRSGLSLTVGGRTHRPVLRAAGRAPSPCWSPDSVHGEPRAVAITPDGRLAVAGTHNSTLAVWTPGDGREPALLVGHADTVTAVAVALDGRRAASGSSDRSVRLWDLEQAVESGGLMGHGGPVTAVDLTGDGRLVAYATTDGTVWLWEPGRSVRPASRQAQGSTPTAVGLTGARGGPVVVSGWRDGEVRCWDVASGRSGTLGGHDGPVTGVAVAPAARLAATTGTDHTVRLWDLTAAGKGRELAGFTGDWPMLACSFAERPGGAAAIVACDAAGVLHTLEVVG